MSTALYRRYRPETFVDVIGQEHVTEPLMQALRTGRVNHAYLFSGPRGCGKTTSARILARCLNCESGPTPEPCGTCDSCVALSRGGSGTVDVIEIDAASHGGVDDARDLRERASYGPAQSRYKIYIIDEAHMVTPQGFNALLKIVEEPPEHVKFVFATTEPEKVIGTIRSRTHHYPFRLVPPARLQAYMEELCVKEGVAVAPGVLSFVVRAGGGSVRDSLSVLDQLIAGSGPDGLTYESAAALLGFTDGELLDASIDAFAAGDAAAVFRAIDKVVETGLDPRRFVEDLLERLRDLIVVAALPDGAGQVLRHVPEDQLERMRRQAAAFGPGALSRAADVVNSGLTEMTGATAPRLQLELIAARILLPGAAGEAGYAARLDRLERRLDVGGVPTAGVPYAAPSPPAAAAPVLRPRRCGPGRRPAAAVPPASFQAPPAAGPRRPGSPPPRLPSRRRPPPPPAHRRPNRRSPRPTTPRASPTASRVRTATSRHPTRSRWPRHDPSPRRCPSPSPSRRRWRTRRAPAASTPTPCDARGPTCSSGSAGTSGSPGPSCRRTPRCSTTTASGCCSASPPWGWPTPSVAEPTPTTCARRSSTCSGSTRASTASPPTTSSRPPSPGRPHPPSPPAAPPAASAGGDDPASGGASSSAPSDAGVGKPGTDRRWRPPATPRRSAPPRAPCGAATRTREPASWSDAPPPPDTAPSWASPLERARATVAVEAETVTEQRVVDDTAISDDDESIDDLTDVGVPVVERILGGTVIAQDPQ